MKNAHPANANLTRSLAAWACLLIAVQVLFFGAPAWGLTFGTYTIGAITSPASVTVPLGAPFYYQITANVGVDQYTANGLPPGLTCNASTGVISGNPSTTGTTQVSIGGYSDSSGASGHVTIQVVNALKVQIQGQGSVTDGFLGVTYPAPGSPLSIQAYPADGYQFSGWSGSLVSGSNPLAFTYSNPLLLQANFTQIPPVITSATTAIAIENYPFNFQLTATNHPSSFRVSNLPLGLYYSWGSITGTPTTTGTSTILIEASNSGGTGSAQLVLVCKAALVTTTSGNGSVNLTGTNLHSFDDFISLLATPAPGSYFAGWSGDLVTPSQSLEFFIGESMALQANFVPFAPPLDPESDGGTSTLWVEATAGGTAQPLGISHPLIGSVVSLSATPANGYLLHHWTIVSGTSESATTCFMANPCLSLSGDTHWSAIFTPWTSYAGNYSAVLPGTDQIGTHSGDLSLKIDSLGSCTGSMVLDGIRYLFKGSFSDRFASILIQRKGRPTLSLFLSLDTSTTPATLSASLAGSDTDKNRASNGPLINPAPNYPFFWTQTVSPKISASFASTAPCPQAGYYTVGLNSPDIYYDNAAGHSFLTLNVTASGLVNMAGLLPDGTPFTSSSHVTPEGQIPVTASAYHRPCCLLGTLNLSSVAAGIAVDGTLQWIRPAAISYGEELHGATTSKVLSAIGGTYRSGQRLVGNLCTFTLSSGNDYGYGYYREFFEFFNFDPEGNPNFDPLITPPLHFRLNRKTGLFYGSFKDSSQNYHHYRGVLLQIQNCGVGGLFDYKGSCAVSLQMTP